MQVAFVCLWGHLSFQLPCFSGGACIWGPSSPHPLLAVHEVALLQRAHLLFNRSSDRTRAPASLNNSPARTLCRQTHLRRARSLNHITWALFPPPLFAPAAPPTAIRAAVPAMVPENVCILIVWHVAHHNMPCPEAARLFGCDSRSVYRFKATYLATGELWPNGERRNTHRENILYDDVFKSGLLEIIEERPELFLREINDIMGALQ